MACILYMQQQLCNMASKLASNPNFKILCIPTLMYADRQFTSNYCKINILCHWSKFTSILPAIYDCEKHDSIFWPEERIYKSVHGRFNSHIDFLLEPQQTEYIYELT